jgi:deoxyuridine 5'-triphosphate nucleotidohydrolase
MKILKKGLLMRYKPAPNIKVAVLPGVDIDPKLLMPHYQTDYAAAVDLWAIRAFNDPKTRAESGEKEFPVIIEPGHQVMFGCGIAMAIPVGIYGDLRPRSGLAASGVNLSNAPGTVDPDYRGEVGMLLRNYTDEPITINHRDRIAQLLFCEYVHAGLQMVDYHELPKTRRSVGGFGSTGISGMGPGESGFLEEQKLLDLYCMSVVINVAAMSNCVRGCKLDEAGHAMRDTNGHLISPKRRLGCVFAQGHAILSTGYNAQYPGSERCEDVGCLRDKLGIESGQQMEQCRAIHAEGMAISRAADQGVNLSGSTMYCNAEPCLYCAKLIAGLDIEAVVVLEGGYSNQEGLKVVREAEKNVRLVKKQELWDFYKGNLDTFAIS